MIDHVLGDAHPEELRGYEVTDLVQPDGHDEAHEHDHDAEEVEEDGFHGATLLARSTPRLHAGCAAARKPPTMLGRVSRCVAARGPSPSAPPPRAPHG